MKKSFILHNDSLSILDKLSDAQKGQLFEAIRQYHLGNIIDLDFALELAFEPFKNQFDRDNEKYLKIVETNRANGSKGGKQKVANGSKRKRTQTNVADKDNDNDKDKGKEELKPSAIECEFLLTINTLTKKNYRKIDIEKLKLRLNTFTGPEIAKAIKNACGDPFQIENGLKYLTPDYFLRNDKQIDKWLNTAPPVDVSKRVITPTTR